MTQYIMSELLDTSIALDTPTSFCEIKTVHSYEYNIMDYLPHTQATYHIRLLDSNKHELKSISGIIEGDDFANWGTDDTYLDNFIKTKVTEFLTANAPSA